tara:strand:+ start:220 stop:564 length:345 start_codon:yes stop_codon:yes gene_type:complete
MKVKFLTLISIFLITSCANSNQLINSEEIYIGMTLDNFCEAVVFTTIPDDPCMGKNKYNKSNKKLVLIPGNKLKFYVFKSVSKVNAAGRYYGTFGILSLITESQNEAEFNLMND